MQQTPNDTVQSFLFHAIYYFYNCMYIHTRARVYIYIHTPYVSLSFLCLTVSSRCQAGLICGIFVSYCYVYYFYLSVAFTFYRLKPVNRHERFFARTDRFSIVPVFALNRLMPEDSNKVPSTTDDARKRKVPQRETSFFRK